jgi:hypothetical protein
MFFQGSLLRSQENLGGNMLDEILDTFELLFVIKSSQKCNMAQNANFSMSKNCTN